MPRTQTQAQVSALASLVLVILQGTIRLGTAYIGSLLFDSDNENQQATEDILLSPLNLVDFKFEDEERSPYDPMGYLSGSFPSTDTTLECPSIAHALGPLNNSTAKPPPDSPFLASFFVTTPGASDIIE